MDEVFEDELDLIPEGYRKYVRKHGRHFSKRLCKFSVSRMKGEDGKAITPMTREEVENLLASSNVQLRKAREYDAVFVANMGLADYLGDSVPDMDHLARYVRNVIDDPDGYDGIAFGRWFSDVCNMRVEVPWEDVM